MDSTETILENIIKCIFSYSTQYENIVSQSEVTEANLVWTFNELKKYWETYIKSEREDSGSKSADDIESIDSCLEIIRTYLSNLSMVDKTFERYYNKHIDEVVLLEETITDDVDYVAKIRDISQNLISLVDKCSCDVASWPIQEFKILFSTKRKNEYRKIISLAKEAFILSQIACEKISHKTQAYWVNLEFSQDQAIEEESLEIADFLLNNAERKERDLNDILFDFETALDCILSNEEVKHILKLQDIHEKHKDGLPDHISEYRIYGEMGINLSHFSKSDPILDKVKSKYDSIMVDEVIILPIIYDTKSANNFYIESTGSANSQKAKDLVHSLMFSQISNLPASRQTFTLCDPESRSRGFEPYLDFTNKHQDIMGGRIYTTQEQIKETLVRLSQYVDESGQVKFVDYDNIYDYNTNVIDKHEPMKTLVILDFPKYFNSEMLDKLDNIIRNGSRFGVGTIIHYNPDFREKRNIEEYNTLLSKIEENVTTLTEFNDIWYLKSGIAFFAAETPKKDDFEKFANTFSEKLVQTRAFGLPLSRIISNYNMGTGSTVEKVSIPFGINEQGNIHSLELGDSVGNGTSHYALVTGSTGSGKSTLLHTIIMSALFKYSPDELNIYLMDFKKGTEFKIYAEKQVPQIKLLAIGDLQEYGQSILKELERKVEERATKFKEASQTGQEIRNIKNYREITSQKMPRILVIVDEFQDMFNLDKNRRIANDCAGCMAHLVSQARAYGIHFVFATQTLSRIYNQNFAINRATLSEMNIRIGLKGSENEARLLFGDKNEATAFSKYGNTEKGTGAYSEDYTTNEPIGFRSAYCAGDLQKELLDKISLFYSQTPTTTRIFEQDSVPSLLSCSGYCNPDPNESLCSVPIYLGEPIMLDKEMKIDVNRLQNNGLLIVGSDEGSMATKIIDLYILNSVKSKHRKLNKCLEKSVFFIDGSRIVNNNPSESTQLIIRKNAEHIEAIDTNQDVIKHVEDLYGIFESRSRKANACEYDSIHVVIKNIQWIEALNYMFKGRDLSSFSTKPDLVKDDLFDMSPPHPNDLSSQMRLLQHDLKLPNNTNEKTISYKSKLISIIENGYLYGINFVISCPDYLSIKDTLNEVLPKFKNRIIFELNERDADKLIPNVSINGIPKNIAIYTNGIDKTFQFKPYDYSEIISAY
jgi:hypothetical protein